MPLSPKLARARHGLAALALPLRASVAVVGCVVAGQLSGRTAAGLVMAVGARRVVLADPGGPPASRAANMALAVVAGALAALAGTLVGHSLAAATLGMFVLGWVAGVARSRSDAAGRLAVSPAILFALAQILPGDLDMGLQRALAVGLGGLLAGALVLAAYPRGWRHLLAQRARAGARYLWRATRLPEADMRFGLALAAMVAGCLLVVRALDLPRGYWVVVSVLVVLRPEHAVTRRRGLDRLLGTLLGSAVGVALVFCVRWPWLLDVCLFLLMVGFFRLVMVAYGWSLAFFTPALVVGISLLEPGNWHWAVNRAVDVAAGSLVAVGAGFFLRGRLGRPPAPLV